ncbi:nucleoside triphosphate pyrophosphohydrolase [Roseofilum reptotaenium CS-1145]|uniref:Nucleoside triphosphate pyrophosphohydrolase n=1 Tax=Roseofilum reptotaenium AO1-A TaxID=1925591 RepID=A0A1L9QQN9_9CYAN|nr:nucleoside triphosphate pyrophosphohydrolase [Roseofilum reptotaenium]MDB9516254.1 nucleoside triphosphate pyrophosphohydrolase [Roseofilum reptotaenium CS-1145]OJJ25008.1 nucleoside triphosphate pyrophosphohydrolase [Roseofilum reptotaenium AO1-A]
MSHSESSIASSLEAMQRLIEVIAQLRSPSGGCPWDLAQTPQSLIPHVIEEAYETVDAIRGGDQRAIAEELGDLLMQVVLQAQIAQENGDFTLKEVADGISDKLIRRHPHVFADVEVESVEDVRQNWEDIKAAEKGKAPNLLTKLERYASTLPPLTAGMKISKKAASAGFEWDDIEGVWGKFEEELAELKQAVAHEDKAAQQGELGDVLFTLITLARWLELDPSEALHGTYGKFLKRLTIVDAISDRPLSEYTLDELEELWQQAKKSEALGNGQ